MHTYNLIEPPRSLSVLETRILEQILSTDFPGSQSLRQQINFIQVAEECQTCPSVVFKIINGDNIKKAEVERTVPIEAEGSDIDGVRVRFLIFVRDGYLDELEIFREDAGKIQKLPTPEALEILLLY